MEYRCVLIEKGKTIFIKDNLTHVEMLRLWEEHHEKEQFKTYSKENEDAMLELANEFQFGKCVYFYGKRKSLEEYAKEEEQDVQRRKEWHDNFSSVMQVVFTPTSPMRKNQGLFSLMDDLQNGEDITKPKVLG